MKFYDLDTEFTFGKFEGNTVRQILDLQPSYLDWCAVNLDHFYISENVIEEIKTIKPDFALTEEGKQKLDEKYSTWETEQEDNEDYDDRDDHDYDRDTFDALTDGQYGDYDDWRDGGGDFDSLRDGLGY